MTSYPISGPAVRPAARAERLPAGRLAALLGVGRAQGAIDMAVGTPAWPAPPAQAIAAACAALHDGHNQYEHPDGNAELRQAIASTFDTPVDPVSELTITVGASEAISTAVLSIVDPGDEVVVFQPFFELSLNAITLAGGRPRFVRLRPPHWRYDPDELASAFGPRTRAVVINTPNNPTGRVFGRSELIEIAGLCAKWDATIISDEVYATYVFDDREHVSPADLVAAAGRVVAVGSLSKSHAVSGWRLGYLRADPALTSVLRRVHLAVTGGAAAPLQVAIARSGVLGSAGWNPGPGLRDLRDRAVAAFSSAGLACAAPEGGCYLMAGIQRLTTEDSETFAHHLLERCGVLVVPGTFFHPDRDGGRDLVRIAFNRPKETIVEAARRTARYAGNGSGVRHG